MIRFSANYVNFVNEQLLTNSYSRRHTEDNEDDAQKQKVVSMKHPARSGQSCAEQSSLGSVSERLLRSTNRKLNRHLRRFQLTSFLSRDGRTSDNVRAQSE